MRNNQEMFAISERVSSDKQVLDGLSLEMQREMALEVVESYNGIVYDYYTEEGLSAKKKRLNQRPVMQKLIADIKEGRVNHVISYRRDRLWRNTLESLEFIQILLDYDCKITLTAREEKQIDLNEYRKNGGAKMMELIMAQFAEMEVENTSIRVSDTMISKAKVGQFTGGIAPYGYKSVKSSLIPIESEIAVIDEIADLYLNGYGTYSIARWLNGIEVRGLGKRKFSHKKLKQHKRAKETWTKESIEGVLFNQSYCGYMSYYSYKNNKFDSFMDGIKVKSEHITPIRTEEKQKEIDRLRRKKNERKTAPRHYSTPFLLSGILTCGECGEKFISRSTSRKDGSVYAYYGCKKIKSTDGDRCKSRLYKKEVIEMFVLNESKRYMEEYINNDTYSLIQKELSKTKSDTDNKVSSLQNDLVDRTRRKDNLMEMLSGLDIEDVTFPIMKQNFQDKIRELLLEIVDIQSTIDELKITREGQENKEIDIEFIENTAKKFSKVIEKAPVNIQKQLIEELFSSVTIDKEGDVTFTISVDIIPANVERVVEFISIGGVGDTTTPIDIKVRLSQESIDINVFDKYQSILLEVSNNLFPFMIAKNKGEKFLYKRMTKNKAIVESSYYHYKNKQRTPSYGVLMRILDELNSNLDEFINFINPIEKAFYAEMIYEVLTNKKEFINKITG